MISRLGRFAYFKKILLNYSISEDSWYLLLLV